MQDGDNRNNSDIDVMILVDLEEDKIMKALQEISYFATDLELEYDIMLSPIMKNIHNFNYWLDTKPFYMNVVNEGVVLHG